jgi:hypothetical protein
MCQKYNDHVKPNSVDNFLDATPSQPQIPFYRFSCGTGGAGSSIMCNKTIGDNCLLECTIFKGYDVAFAQGMGGVAAIRNATFFPNYQSPVQAGTQNLDFIVVFY